MKSEQPSPPRCHYCTHLLSENFHEPGCPAILANLLEQYSGEQCAYCTYPLESGQHHPKCFSLFEGKQDNFDEYFSAEIDIEKIRGEGLTAVDELPEEEIDHKDVDAFKRYEKMVDFAGNIWLTRVLLEKRFTKVHSQIREMGYLVSKKLEIPAVEYRTLKHDGKDVLATRFLPNAIDGRIREASPKAEVQLSKDLSKIWVLNYFLGNRGDLQVMTTSSGHALLSDYSVSKSIPDDLLTNPQLIDTYRDFIGGVEERVDLKSVEEAVLGIEQVSMEEIEEIASVVEDEEKRSSLVEAFRWRKEHVRVVFAHVLE